MKPTLPAVKDGHGNWEERPALGYLDNLKRVNDTLYADIVDIPMDALKKYDEMQKRSIEVRPEEFQIVGLALLGTSEPFHDMARVTSLDAARQSDGLFTIKNVPIFRTNIRDGVDYTVEWIDKAIAMHVATKIQSMKEVLRAALVAASQGAKAACFEYEPKRKEPEMPELNTNPGQAAAETERLQKELAEMKKTAEAAQIETAKFQRQIAEERMTARVAAVFAKGAMKGDLASNVKYYLALPPEEAEKHLKTIEELSASTGLTTRTVEVKPESAGGDEPKISAFQSGYVRAMGFADADMKAFKKSGGQIVVERAKPTDNRQPPPEWLARNNPPPVE